MIDYTDPKTTYGNLIKMPQDPERCVQGVISYSVGIFKQCDKKRVGKYYCKIHSPVNESDVKIMYTEHAYEPKVVELHVAKMTNSRITCVSKDNITKSYTMKKPTILCSSKEEAYRLIFSKYKGKMELAKRKVEELKDRAKKDGVKL